MKRVVFAAILTILMGVSTSAQAWWWGPGWGPWGNGWGNDWFGNGWFDFNMSFGGWGRGYYHPYWGGYYPYYGYYPYAYGGYPYWAPPTYLTYPYAVKPVAPAPATSADK
jgi:hypothetical protein